MQGNSKLDDAVSLISACIDREGYDLVELKLNENRRYIRIFIDRIGGVTIDDCVRVMRVVSDELRNITPFDDYRLEVSSPGIERELKNERDLNRNIGRFVKVLTIPAQEGASIKIRGYLKSVNDEQLIIDTENGPELIPRTRIKKISGDVEFGTRSFRRRKGK